MSDLKEIYGDNRNIKPENFDFEALPKGLYKAQLVGKSVSVASTGAIMINIEEEILEGEYEGRHIFENLVLKKADGTVNRIGSGLLSSLSNVSGYDGIPENSDMLMLKPHIIKLDIEPGTNGYKDKNKIKGFFKCPDKWPVTDPVKKASTLPAAVEDDQPDFLKD